MTSVTASSCPTDFVASGHQEPISSAKTLNAVSRETSTVTDLRIVTEAALSGIRPLHVAANDDVPALVVVGDGPRHAVAELLPAPVPEVDTRRLALAGEGQLHLLRGFLPPAGVPGVTEAVG